MVQCGGLRPVRTPYSIDRNPMLRRCLVVLIGLVTLVSVLATDLWLQRRLQGRELAERNAPVPTVPGRATQGR